MLTEQPQVANACIALAEEWRLYTKADSEQWNADTDLPWDREIVLPRGYPTEIGRQMRARMLSQFFYGEQGAFLLCSQLVERIEDTEARLYLASQVVDEARHVEVFGRYLNLLDAYTPMNPWLRELEERILEADSVIEKLIGTQIMVEGLALDVFADMRQSTPCTLLQELLYRVKQDEARHVGFGLTHLPRLVERATPAERMHLQDAIQDYARLLLMVAGGPGPFSSFIFSNLRSRLGHVGVEFRLS